MSVYIDKSLNSPRYNFYHNISQYMSTPEIYEPRLYAIKTLTHHIQDPWGNRELDQYYKPIRPSRLYRTLKSTHSFQVPIEHSSGQIMC
jgi:hypothetical protein